MSDVAARVALIAGGAGFIGSHLAESLLRDGYRIIIVDNFMTGSRNNLAHLLQNPDLASRIIVIEASVRQPLSLGDALLGTPFENSKIAEIYNLASPASPKHYQKDPIDTLLTNVVGSENLLTLAAANNADYFQASTSEVYGDPAVHPQTETYWGNVNPIGIRSCYDEGKRAAESLCFDYFRTKGIRVKVGRIFNTYGPRMAEDDGRVVSNFIIQALRNEDITLYGSGSQSRSFQYVDDLVLGILAVMRQQDIGPFNLGNPDEFTIRDLAEKIIAMTESKSAIVEKPLPQDDPTRRRPDISRARALGWEPKIKLEDGLRKTIEYFQSLQKNIL